MIDYGKVAHAILPGDSGGSGVSWLQLLRKALAALLTIPQVNVQSGLLTFGAIWVAAAAGISAPWNYTMIRVSPCTPGVRYSCPCASLRLVLT